MKDLTPILVWVAVFLFGIAVSVNTNDLEGAVLGALLSFIGAWNLHPYIVRHRV